VSEQLRWWDRLNRAVFPFMGPAQLGPGPGGERATDSANHDPRCPLCGEPMDAHVIERAADWHTATRLHCP
jgi:hypothetical protein